MMSETTCSNSVSLTPVDYYADRFEEQSKLRNWPFTSKDVAKLRKELKVHDHESPFRPISLNICLGDDLQYNWSEAIEWLRSGVKDLGYKLISSINPNKLSYLSVVGNQSKRCLTVVKLDLDMFWNPQVGHCSLGLLPNYQVWPSIEVVIFLAMNPQVAINMDGVKIPFMYAPGLEVKDNPGLNVGETGIPCFYQTERKIYVIADSQNAESIRRNVSFVAYAG